MEPIELLRTSILSTTNNPDLTDAIIRIFEVSGDDTEVAMEALGNLVGYEMGEFIMQLADIAFDREPGLCVDPRYHDATVENEARPKHPTGCFVMEIRPQGNPMKVMRDEQQWQHIRKFNPLLEKEIIRFNNMTDFEKLMYMTAKEMAQKYPVGGKGPIMEADDTKIPERIQKPQTNPETNHEPVTKQDAQQPTQQPAKELTPNQDIVPITSPIERQRLRNYIINAIMNRRIMEHAATGSERYDGMPVMQAGHAEAEAVMNDIIQRGKARHLHPIGYYKGTKRYLAVLVVNGTDYYKIITTNASYPITKKEARELKILTFFKVASPSEILLLKRLINPDFVSDEEYEAAKGEQKADKAKLLKSDMASMAKKTASDFEVLDAHANNMNTKVQSGQTDAQSLLHDMTDHTKMANSMLQSLHNYTVKDKQYQHLMKQINSNQSPKQ